MTIQTASMIGWREWVSLPDFCSSPIKAKVDTGAKTSSLHAPELELVEEDGVLHARFEIHPDQNSTAGMAIVTTPVVDFRTIRSSNGQEQRRPVVRTVAHIGDRTMDIELTLASREAMGFRMLLGRRVLSERFWVDPGRSFLLKRRN